MPSSIGDASAISTAISGDSSDSFQYIALVVSSIGFLVAIVNGLVAYLSNKNHIEELAKQKESFEEYKKDLDNKQRRVVRFENVKELMKQYKKPLLHSAFYLQRRLAYQVKNNFLYKFNQEDRNKDNQRDRNYAKLNTTYVISEFLGWLEVIRQEIVFIVGEGNQTSNLNLIVDDIEYQFTGDSAVQGNFETESNWNILQLYKGELRAIGEVMLTERSNSSSKLSVIGYAEFVRRLDSITEDTPAGRASKEKHHQTILFPLLSYIKQLMDMDDTQTPKDRIVILQVLLCKLIDLLDDAVPYEVGPEFDLDGDDEPQYISRDFRLSPLVSCLSPTQREWLSGRPYMKVAEENLQFPNKWKKMCRGLDMSKQLFFPGFRKDLYRDNNDMLISQAEREELLGTYPPLKLRVREDSWWEKLPIEEFERWSKEAKSKGVKVPITQKLGASGGPWRRKKSMVVKRNTGGNDGRVQGGNSPETAVLIQPDDLPGSSSEPFTSSTYR